MVKFGVRYQKKRDKPKIWENLKAKSLKAFCDKYKPKYAARTSMSDFRQQDWMTNIPLYNIDKISEILDE